MQKCCRTPNNTHPKILEIQEHFEGLASTIAMKEFRNKDLSERDPYDNDFIAAMDRMVGMCADHFSMHLDLVQVVLSDKRFAQLQDPRICAVLLYLDHTLDMPYDAHMLRILKWDGAILTGAELYARASFFFKAPSVEIDFENCNTDALFNV